MSGQSIEDQKGFVRILIDDKGLTLHPIVVDEVCHDWELPIVDTTNGQLSVPRPLSPIAPRLVENPIRISRVPTG
jgi:hypothetical protein